METKPLQMQPKTWQQFAFADGIVTAQAQGGSVYVYFGDTSPAADAAYFTFPAGAIIGPIADNLKAWARGGNNSSIVYFSAPKTE